jgi:hypothetical protein
VRGDVWLVIGDRRLPDTLTMKWSDKMAQTSRQIALKVGTEVAVPLGMVVFEWDD